MVKNHRRLSNIREIKRLIADTINERRAGAIDSTMARDLGYLAKILADLIEGSDFEARISALEARAANSEHSHALKKAGGVRDKGRAGITPPRG